MLLVSIAFKGLTTYAQLRFALMREYSIGRRLIEGYLHQPYVWFLDHHSSDLGKTILSEVSAVINGGMIPLMNLVAQSAVAIALLILLLFVDTRLALTVGSVLALSYFVIIKLTSNWLLHLGKERILANQARFNTVSEAFSAFKEVKLAGLENFILIASLSQLKSMQRSCNCPDYFTNPVLRLRALLLGVCYWLYCI